MVVVVVVVVVVVAVTVVATRFRSLEPFDYRDPCVRRSFVKSQENTCQIADAPATGNSSWK